MKKATIQELMSGTLAVLMFFMQTADVSAAFSDVPATNPQSNAIEELRLQNVINGYPDKTFKPDKLISRGEFLKMVFNDVGYRAAPNGTTTPFIDVPADNWTAPYVKKALEINVISANGATPTFNPDKPVIRADAVKIAFAISGIPAPYYTDINPTDLFQDVHPNAWYVYLARAAKLNGIVSLKHPELFWANHLMTRGDAAELIYEVQLARENGTTTDGTNGSNPPFVTSTTTVNNLTPLDAELLNNPKFSILLDVWDKANTEFYNKASINQDELVYGAIKGMVDKLGDQYTVFEEPSDALGLQQYLQGEFEGVGTVIDISNNKAVILKTIPNSPAEKANLKTGDVITKINGQSLDNMTINQAVDLIRGQVGTSVTLSIQRNGQTFDVNLTREKITLSSVSGKIIGSLAYISITEFTQTTPDDFTKTLTDLNKQNPAGYILDLRDNPGGYLDSAITMLGHFVENGTTVVYTKAPDNTTTNYVSKGPGELKGKKLAVLVNENSASAAEIMAGALQDLKTGKLVGNKTYGKGSVQEITNYTDDSLLKISIAHWLTPNRTDINGNGLTPDVSVDLDQQQLLQGTDSQLQKAETVLNGGM